MEVSVDDWRDWAYKKELDNRIISYITSKNEHLFTFDAKSEVKSFATPRSWEYVDSILQSEVNSSTMLEVLSGAIGREVAVSFLGFIKVMDRLPNIEVILMGESKEYSDEVDVLYALSSSLVSGILKDISNLENVLSYTLDLKSEFSVMIIQDLQRNGVKMEHSKIFKIWVKKFSYLLM